MRKLLAAVVTVAFTLTIITYTRSASPRQDHESALDTCSCTAKDGSCSVSVSCSGGCIKHCGYNDDCYAYCSGSYAFLAREVTFEVENGRYPEFVDKLSRASGKQIEFSPSTPDAVFTTGFKRATVWDALKVLSDHGKVRIAGQDFEELRRLRRNLLSGERVSFGVKKTTVSAFVNDISSLTGLPLRITAGRPMSNVNIDLKEATLDEIINAVADQTGTRITEEGAGSR